MYYSYDTSDDIVAVTCCELCNYYTYIYTCSPDSTHIWDNPYDGQIRLQRGTYSNQGLVEIYCNGEWGTMCDDFFGYFEATVICRQLGYNSNYRYDHLPMLVTS